MNRAVRVFVVTALFGALLAFAVPGPAFADDDPPATPAAAPTVSNAYIHNGDGSGQRTTETNASNRTTVPFRVLGSDIAETGSVSVSLVGTGATAGIQIDLDNVTVTQAVLPLGSDRIDGFFDLSGRAPGPYLVRVVNEGAGGGATTYDGDIAVVAVGQPTITSPSKGSPVTVAYDGTTQLTITGTNLFEGVTFSTGDPAMTLGNVQVDPGNPTTATATVTTTATTPNGRYDLVATNTDGQMSGVCDDCLRQVGAPLEKWEWQVRLTLSPGNPQLEFQLGDRDEVPLACDWDGDGRDSPATFDLATRTWTLYDQAITGSGVTARFAYGRPGDGPTCGDWNGDGRDTVGVFRGNEFLLRNSNTPGNADIAVAYGRGSHKGDLPVVGDWDGDGVDTLGIRRNNEYFLRNRNSTGVADIVYGYGIASDTRLSGDFNNNGADSPGVRRGNRFLLRTSNTTGPATFDIAYGTADQVPIIADFNGNGFDDLAVLRQV